MSPGFFNISALFIALPLLTSCYIPIPTPEFGLLSGKGEVSSEVMVHLSNTNATREQVLLRLGTPSAVSNDQSVFLYDWVTHEDCVYAFVAEQYYCFAKLHHVYFQFSNDQRLQRLEHIQFAAHDIEYMVDKIRWSTSVGDLPSAQDLERWKRDERPCLQPPHCGEILYKWRIGNQ